jgi:hypothetical protein
MKIVYIAGLGHSGSTLLDLLISSHEQIYSLGEAKNLNPRDLLNLHCSCGTSRAWGCPYWQEVGRVLEQEHGIDPRELDVMSNDRTTFVEHNLALFRSVATITGKKFLVDSSKNPSRLRRMLESDAFDVYPVQLSRDPRGVVYSNAKKERNWFGTATRWSRVMLRTQYVLREMDHTVVHYEQLATDPERVLRELMPRIGLEFEPGQLEWAGRERHNFGGNRMRQSKSSEIRLDESWRTGLSPWQRAIVNLVTLPARR